MNSMLQTYALELLSFLSVWFLSTLLAALSGRRTQVDTWVAARPKLALLVRVSRAVGFDPWLIVKAGREYMAQRSTTKAEALKAKAARIAAGPIVALAIALPLITSCGTHVNAPTARDAAILAWNLSDDALAVIIEKSNAEDAEKYAGPVGILARAKTAIETTDDACGQLDNLRLVVAVLDCVNCEKSVKVLEGICK